MKRFSEFIKQLSLSQQLAAIIFFLISFFTAFFFIYLTGSVENVIREQMYTTLDTSQDMIVGLYSGQDSSNFTQSQLRRALTNSQMHLIVDMEEVIAGEEPQLHYLSSESDAALVREELSENSALVEKMISQGVTIYQNGLTSASHGHMKINGQEYCYSVRLMNDGSSNVLMSYMDEEYAQGAKDMMINSILYITVMAFCFIFLILMLWVITLIHPLNQIRNYIEKIKAGKEATLKLNRKDEIGELADALVSMREELQKQEKTKEEMIHNISHDLKTPIATIKSYGESIKDGIYPYETLEKSVDVIIENADRLEAKVHSLLYMNRVEYLISQDNNGAVTNMKDVVEKVLLNIAVIKPDIRIEVFDGRLDGDNAPGVFSDCEVVCECLDQADQKAMLVESLLLGTGCTVVSCSGMAGFGSSNEIVTRKRMRRLYVCGDGVSEASEGPGLTAARVMVCAGHVANMAIRLLLGEDKP